VLQTYKMVRRNRCSLSFYN